MSSTEPLRRPPPSWKRWRVVVPALAAIPLLAVGLDCAARVFAESQTADAFQRATGVSTSPHVRIGGTPVLTQMARGTLDRVDISAEHIPAGADSPVPVSDLDVHMTKVRKNSDANAAHAGSATATAFVSYQDLSDALGIEVKAGSAPGHITASVMAPMVGEFTVNARVVKGGPASIAFKDVSVASDQLPASAGDLLSRVFDRDIPLDNIPKGLTLDRISTGSTGLTVELSGRDVTFKTSGSSAVTQSHL